MVVLRLPLGIERRAIGCNPGASALEFHVHIAGRFFRCPDQRVRTRRRVSMQILHDRGFVHEDPRMHLDHGDSLRAFRVIKDSFERRDAGVRGKP